MNYLRPSVKRGQIAPDEEDLILRLHRLLGNKWSLIAGRIPGRTDNEIKNYWNTHLSKKLISQGIDPRTHKPLKAESSDKHIKAVSSKENHKASPTNKPNLVSSGFESTTSGNTQIIGIKGNEIFQNNSIEDYDTGIDYTNLMNYEGFGMDLASNQGLSNEDEDIGAAFSSFLNSLLNDEAFPSQQPQIQQPTNGVVSDPLVSVTTSELGLSNGWESALTTSAHKQSDPDKVDEHVES